MDQLRRAPGVVSSEKQELQDAVRFGREEAANPGSDGACRNPSITVEHSGENCACLLPYEHQPATFNPQPHAGRARFKFTHRGVVYITNHSKTQEIVSWRLDGTGESIMPAVASDAETGLPMPTRLQAYLAHTPPEPCRHDYRVHADTTSHIRHARCSGRRCLRLDAQG